MICPPARGGKLRASWGAAVTEVCNAVRSIGTPGMLVCEGPQGTGFRPLPANLRDRGGGGSTLPAGCFELSYDTELEDYTFANPYYLVGGVLKAAAGLPSVSSLAAAAGDEAGAAEVFVCAKIQATAGGDALEIVAYNGFEALAAAQRDPLYLIVPVYKLAVVVREGPGGGEPSRSWSVECDFRRGVQIGPWEAL